jgi:hypothetical protein
MSAARKRPDLSRRTKTFCHRGTESTEILGIFSVSSQFGKAGLMSLWLFSE